jgi:PAS domain S-box-containing protein
MDEDLTPPSQDREALHAAPTPLAILSPQPEGGFAFVRGNQSWNRLVRSWNGRVVARIVELVEQSDPASRGNAEMNLGGRSFAVRWSPTDSGALVVHVSETAGSFDEVRQLRDLFNSATALIYVKDPEGRYLLANGDFMRRFGLQDSEVIGHTDWDLYPQESASAYSANDAKVLRQLVPIQVEEPYGEPSGLEDLSRRWISIKFPLLDDEGVPYGIGAISTDITERKRVEDAVSWARWEAERANQRKDEFLSRMSHELRTPLNAIIGFTQLLDRFDLDPDARAHVGEIAGAGRHLLSLVDDALDLSWLEAGSPGMNLARVDAARPFHHAVRLVSPLAQEADVALAVDLHGAVGLRVIADERRLLQVFLNLIQNAVKFNQTGGLVRVSVRDLGTRLRYRVTDTGRGLTEEDAQRLFSPFTRLPGSENVSGSGLGLELSRRLMERMGGSVGLERSAPGEGSTFYVDVVKATPRPDYLDEIDDLQIPELPHVPFAATIVQIEDTPANQRLVAAVVEAMGETRLHSATTGETGLRLIDQLRPDLVLLDLNLPDMTAAQVLELMRRSPVGGDVPVIVLSADATPRRAEELAAFNIHSFMTKPFDVFDLATTIVQALQRRRAP